MAERQVQILIGSDSDASIMQKAIEVLAELDVSCHMTVASAHRSPDRVRRLIDEAPTHGVKVFIDPTSLMYMSGSSIDYVDNLMGGGFSIDNPQAVASCGCGHSFRTTENSSSSPPAASSGGCGSCG